MQQTLRKLAVAMTVSALAACASDTTRVGAPEPAARAPGTSADAVPFDQIRDAMTPGETRAYGRTSPTKVRTRIGDIEFTDGGFAGGYPTLASTEKLTDELDFQRATQAYLWALPLVSYGEWLRAHEEVFHAGDGDIVQSKTPQAKQGILTANVTTPYAVSFADLTRTGPLVLEVPAGPSAGVIDDMWERAIADFGVSGPDKGKGARYLILGPGMAAPQGLDSGKFRVVQNLTNVVFIAIRALQPDPADADTFLRKVKIYPYDKRDSDPKTRVIVVGDDIAWGQWQPRGMDYWRALKTILDREVVAPRDRLMLSMLDSLGLRKGEAFNPDARQKRLLKEAAVVGEAMAKATTFDKPFANGDLYRGTHWDQLLIVPYDDRAEYTDQMYRRAAFTYEAVSRGKAYYIQKPGIGQQYRTAYKDADGQFLLGREHYTLTMPKNPPAKIFWSVVVYDVNTRTPIINSEWRAVVSSRTGLKENANGSVVLHFSPKLPAGVAKENWIQTNPEESWFTYLRFYGPTKEYFDQSYPLQDIQRVK